MRLRCRVARKAALLLLAAIAMAATRPRYGGVLRVELRERMEDAEPAASGQAQSRLNGVFSIAKRESGHVAYAAEENAPGGRPFVDSVEVNVARPMRERAIELGRADIVELAPNELRRAPSGQQRIWASAPVRVVALVFGPRVEDPRIRQALTLAVDRAGIHNVLLRGQGEISGALLPQWVSGHAFLFPGMADMARARSLATGAPAAARALTLAADDRPVADRIALNARDAGLTVSVVAASANADVRLAQARVVSENGPQALAVIAAAFGLGEPPKPDTAEALYAAERTLLDGFRVVPLFHLPDLYAVSPRVKGGPGITKLGEWRFESLWIDRP
jgi:hypothetical protein